MTQKCAEITFFAFEFEAEHKQNLNLETFNPSEVRRKRKQL